MLNEALLIVPENDNSGRSLAHVHNVVRAALVRAYGGFTAVGAAGGWQGPGGKVVLENVVTYTVAMPTASERYKGAKDQWAPLRYIAQEMKRAAKQESVYVRWPNGAVEFI